MHYTIKPLKEDQLVGSFSISSSEEENLDILCYEKLLKGIVHFEFKKKDGSTRRAIGTLNSELIPPVDYLPLLKELNDEAIKYSEAISKGNPKDVQEANDDWDDVMGKVYDLFKEKTVNPRKDNPEIQKYYDFESKGWRSFNKESLIAIYE